MNKFALMTSTLFFMTPTSASAEQLAYCSEPEGFGYVSNFGVVPESRAGWIPEKITGGSYKLVSKSGKYFCISKATYR